MRSEAARLTRAAGALGLMIAAMVPVEACRSSSAPSGLAREQLLEARDALSGPLPGALAALYRLRVPSSGGLSFSVLAMGAEGRITISEPFGSALSITAWSGTAAPEVFDLREGCRFTAGTLEGVLGVSSLPVPEAVLLLGGHLPATPSDRVSVSPEGRLRVSGRRWAGLVTVAPEPWRVIEVEDAMSAHGDGWRIRLRDHRLAVPGWVKAWTADGRWAELDLLRLQWNRTSALPELPALPVCAETRRRGAPISEPGTRTPG